MEGGKEMNYRYIKDCATEYFANIDCTKIDILNYIHDLSPDMNYNLMLILMFDIIQELKINYGRVVDH